MRPSDHLHLENYIPIGRIYYDKSYVFEYSVPRFLSDSCNTMRVPHRLDQFQRLDIARLPVSFSLNVCHLSDWYSSCLNPFQDGQWK